MRLAGISALCSAYRTAMAAVSLVLVVILLTFLANVAPVSASSPALTLEVDAPLSLVGETVRITVEGVAEEPLTGAQILVRVNGPAQAGRVGEADDGLPEVGAFPLVLTEAIAATGGTIAEAATVNGPWRADVDLPVDLPGRAGAFLVTVSVRSDGATRAMESVWIGKLDAREQPLDLAFVWPVALGIHRDPSGAFFDPVLDRSLLPASEDPDGLVGSLEAIARSSGWRVSLAIEPILLTQLRDMADGFVRVDAAGGRSEVSADDPAAANAAATISDLKALAGSSSVQMLVSPWAGPDLAGLAAAGWRDGFEQNQLGKQELQQGLEMQDTLVGAYSPDLNLTTDSLSYYGRASIDHVLVDDGVAADLAEPLSPGTVAARVRDSQNDRVTVVFANSRLGAQLVEPWDSSMFLAALAAELAVTPADAVVITPAAGASLPPGRFLEALGRLLTRLDWVETMTLAELLRAHPAGTRPVLLDRVGEMAETYIGRSVWTSIQEAHDAVVDLATVADSTRTTVEEARRLLYTAESRWWVLPATSPTVAGYGLAYAEEARALARGELDKIRVAGSGSTLVLGNTGETTLVVENAADYPMEIEVRLEGDGLVLAEGGATQVEAQPGRTEVSIPVGKAEGAHRLTVRLFAGESRLDEVTFSVRFLTIMSFAPWAALAVIVLGAAAYGTVRLRRRNRRRA